MILIIAYIFIILGFIIWFKCTTTFSIAGKIIYRKKEQIKQESVDLMIGVVKEIRPTKDKYNEVLIAYSLDEGETYLEQIIETKKKHLEKNVVIRMLDNGTVELYEKSKVPLIASLLCWTVGLVLCVFVK